MTGKTAGQLAYEAFMLTHPPDVPGDAEVAIANTWKAMGAKGRERWEAVGRAVETGQIRAAREDRDQVRGRMLALAARLEDEAAASSYALESTPLAETAARIRKGLDI